MSFLFGKEEPAPVVVQPAAPTPVAAPVQATVAPKSEVEAAIDLRGEAAAEEEVKKTKKKRGFASTIATGPEGLETEAPVKKKKLGS